MTGRAARRKGASTGAAVCPGEGLLTAAALYRALTLVIVVAFRGLERRYLGCLVR